jgi:hypothetical protein
MHMLRRLIRTHCRTLTLTAALLVAFAASQSVAYAAGVHRCTPGPDSNPRVTMIRTNTSCKKARYFGYLVAVPRGTFPYASRTWKGRKSHANGRVEFIFTTVGRGPLLKVWVLF